MDISNVMTRRFQICIHILRFTKLYSVCSILHVDYSSTLSPRVPAHAAKTSAEEPKEAQKLRKTTFFALPLTLVVRMRQPQRAWQSPYMIASSNSDLNVYGCVFSMGIPILICSSLSNPNYSHPVFLYQFCFLPGHSKSYSQWLLYQFLAFRAYGTWQVLRNSCPSTVPGNVKYMVKTRHWSHAAPKHVVSCYNTTLLKVMSGPSNNSEIQTKSDFCGQNPQSPEFSPKFLSAMKVNTKIGLRTVLCQPAVPFEAHSWEPTTNSLPLQFGRV